MGYEFKKRQIKKLQFSERKYYQIYKIKTHENLIINRLNTVLVRFSFEIKNNLI
jgi:hypothetical protein